MKWPGQSELGSVVLPLDERLFEDVPHFIELPEAFLTRKKEFHITLLSRSEGSATAGVLPIDGERQFQIQNWQWIRTGEQWLIGEPRSDGPSRWSVIELLELPALEAFRTALSRVSGIPLPSMPPHVTLLVAGAERGIGLDSEADFHKLRIRSL